MWKRIDRCITGSLCFSSETNTTLQINGTSGFFFLMVIKKEKKSITSYSHWFLRKIWPRTWPFLILIRERNELTTLAASTNKNLEKPVCSPQSATSPVSRACYLSTYRTATREKLGRHEETQLLSEQGGCKFCSPRSVPSPGSTRTGGHSNTPREPLTQDRPGQEVGCNREHRGAQLQTPESAPPPHAQHQHHRVNSFSPPLHSTDRRKHTQMLETCWVAACCSPGTLCWDMQDSEVLFPSSPPSPPSPPHCPPQGSQLSHCASSPTTPHILLGRSHWFQRRFLKLPLNLSPSFLFSSHLLSLGLLLIFFLDCGPSLLLVSQFSNSHFFNLPSNCQELFSEAPIYVLCSVYISTKAFSDSPLPKNKNPLLSTSAICLHRLISHHSLLRPLCFGHMSSFLVLLISMSLLSFCLEDFSASKSSLNTVFF